MCWSPIFHGSGMGSREIKGESVIIGKEVLLQ